MELLETVKVRTGVFYSDDQKDAEVQAMIDAAQLYFLGAGWDVSAPSALSTEAIVLYVKIAQSTDPTLLNNHPVLISFIAQNRGGTSD